MEVAVAYGHVLGDGALSEVGLWLDSGFRASGLAKVRVAAQVSVSCSRTLTPKALNPDTLTFLGFRV